MRAYLMISSLLALSSVSLLPRAAHAEADCTVDSDCVKGWTCQVTGGTACASPGCAPGEKCDPAPSDCVTQEFKSCRPGPCQSNSDCADDMVCYTETETSCPPVACAPGQTCPEPDCTTRTRSECVPRYVPPCASASDCGTGFTCEANNDCVCSVSAPGTGGSAAAPPPEPECTCKPSGEKRCQPTVATCSADGDCPSGWTCAVVASSGGCATAPQPAPSPAPVPGSGGQSGGTPTPPPDCVAPTEIKQCVPPYFGLYPNKGGFGDPTRSGSAEDSPAPVGNPASGSGQQTTTGAVPAAPTDDASKPDTTASAGCSVAQAPRKSPLLAVFGVLGLLGVLRRRRAA